MIKFGLLSIIDENKFSNITKGMHVNLSVKCDCGNIVIVRNTDLQYGKVKSCGCLVHQPAKNRIDLTNRIFYELKVLKFLKTKNKVTFWLCLCSCGNRIAIRGHSLLSGNTKSCGCKKSKWISYSKIKHNLSRTGFYKVWRGIKTRCLNSNNPKYKDYDGRGIKVCYRWIRFENFRDDMYASYLKHVKEFGEKNTSLDRVDVNSNYESSNCRWVTIAEQNRNRRDSAITRNYDEHLYWKLKLRHILYQGLFRGLKTSKTFEKYLGCTSSQFKQYIELKFLPGMSWNNYGQGNNLWQFDHIIGCNNFDLSKEEDRKKCFYYKNLRPMWEVEHKKKSIKRLF